MSSIDIAAIRQVFSQSAGVSQPAVADLKVGKNAQPVTFRKSDLQAMRGYNKMVRVTAQQAVPSTAFNTGSQYNTQFYLTNSGLDYVNAIYLRINVTNSSGSVTVLPAPPNAWVTRVDIGQGGSVFESLTPEGIGILNALEVNYDQQLDLAPYNFTNPVTYASTTSGIAPNASQDVLLRIPSSILTSGYLPLSALSQQSQLTMTFYFNNGQSLFLNTASVNLLSVNIVELWLQGFSIEPSLRAAILQKHKQAPFVSACELSQLNTQPMGAQAAATQFPTILSWANGACSYLGFVILPTARYSPSTGYRAGDYGYAWTSWVPITNLAYFRDDLSNPITPESCPSSILLAIAPSNFDGGTYGQNLYTVPMAVQPGDSLSNGRNTGAVLLNGSNQFAVTENITTAYGCDLCILVKYRAFLLVDQIGNLYCIKL